MGTTSPPGNPAPANAPLRPPFGACLAQPYDSVDRRLWNLSSEQPYLETMTSFQDRVRMLAIGRPSLDATRIFMWLPPVRKEQHAYSRNWQTWEPGHSANE